MKKSRLNIEMSQQARYRLELLKKETQADSLAQVVGRALAVYEDIYASKISGCRVTIRAPDGKDRDVVLF